MKVEMENCRMIKPTNINVFDHPFRNLLVLTNFDLAMYPAHVRLIYAFQHPTPPTSLLEEGLAKALAEFREWAGRFTKDDNGRPAIHLNDEGVALVEARADGFLAEAMPFDHNTFVQQLIPSTNGVDELLLIQLTRFTCGGLVIGIARHHHVADGAAAVVFMSAWSQLVRGQAIDPLPIHDRSLLMARNPLKPIFDHIEYNGELGALPPKPKNLHPRLVTKTLHFSIELLKQLKATASKNAETPYTRFESLAAHLWRCVSEARGLDGELVTRAMFSVNGRNRLNPPLPFEYFGNVISIACPRTTVKDLVDQPLDFAAKMIHDEVTRMDNDYIRSAIDFLELRQKMSARIVRLAAHSSLSPHLGITSWVNFPIYELDFGWGGPVYAGPVLTKVEGLCFFVPSYTKDGSIDVVICLLEEDMAKLEQICYAV